MANIQELEKRIKALEDWKKEKERQQITFPLDQNSLDVIHQRLLKFANKSTSTVTADKSIKVVIDGQAYQINVL